MQILFKSGQALYRMTFGLKKGSLTIINDNFSKVGYHM
jgi:hypothetical protein